MVHVVDARNGHLYLDEFEQGYRLRHRVFVDERGWEALRRSDNRESDLFDDDHAVHFMVIRNRKVVGYCRLLPTTKPHLLRDVYPSLCEVGAVPVGSDIWEWTRYCVAPEWRFGAAVSDVGTEIIIGVFEYCLLNGIARLSLQADPIWITRFTELGCVARPLGLPTVIDGETVVAFTITVNRKALKTACALRSCMPGLLEDRSMEPERAIEMVNLDLQ